MAVSTHSVFYYNYEITQNNNTIGFNEGAANLVASVQVGSYSLTEFIVEIKTALDAAGGLTYTVSVDRDTRRITISAGSNFSLLVSDGRLLWTLLGFSGADKSGASTYTGTLPSGDEFLPQFILQDFTDSEDFQQIVESSVLESASGRVEVVSFGTRKLFEMSFKFINNTHGDGVLIKKNSTGLEDARAFMQFAILKKPLEFMQNESTRSSFKKVILERTATDSSGTGYKISEMVDRGLPGYYEINNLVFRSLT